VYCDLFSEDFWESAPKAKGEATEAIINTTKDRHRFEDMFISSLLFERLEGAVFNFDARPVLTSGICKRNVFGVTAPDLGSISTAQTAPTVGEIPNQNIFT
jgi:hypothetical protein